LQTVCLVNVASVVKCKANCGMIACVCFYVLIVKRSYPV